MSKFTFKRHPKETGLAAIGRPHPFVDIKLGGKKVGQIKPPSAFSSHDQFLIMLMVVDGTDKAGWSWVTLKFRGETEQACRDFLAEHAGKIQDKYPLFRMEDN